MGAQKQGLEWCSETGPGADDLPSLFHSWEMPYSGCQVDRASPELGLPTSLDFMSLLLVECKDLGVLCPPHKATLSVAFRNKEPSQGKTSLTAERLEWVKEEKGGGPTAHPRVRVVSSSRELDG